MSPDAASISNTKGMDGVTSTASIASTLQVSKHGVSCTECQRRKQRCSKDWPCGHCQNRRVPHLCHFPSKNGTQNLAGVKRKGTNHESLSTIYSKVADDDLAQDISDMGYMDGVHPFDVKKTLGESERIVSPKYRTYECPKDQILNRPSELPARSLTDKLVHEYLNNYNYHYYCTYPPAFLRDYVDWWNKASQRLPLSKSFTTLLLRILALAVQFIKEETRRQIEYELAESPQILTEKYNAAADRLSQEIGFGQGGLHHVEQLFLSACWLKAEAKFVESWHALGRTIREAQEQGLHQEEIMKSVEFDEWHSALHRRIWSVLYLWDYYMGGWLGRPFTIDHSKCHIYTDALQIKQSGTDPDPFNHIALQCKLIQAVFRHHSLNDSELTAPHLLELQGVYDKWQDDLPEHLKLNNPDASFDKEHCFVPFQRLQLHACASVMRLMPLKAYLVKPVPPNSTPEEDQLRERAVTCALGLLTMDKTLFDLGIDAKDHLVTFCLFDAGAVACSAIIHGVGKAVGRDEEIRDAINTTLVRLADLAKDSKPAAKSHRVLSQLIRRLPPHPASDGDDGRRMAKKVKIQPATSINTSTNPSTGTSASDWSSPPCSIVIGNGGGGDLVRGFFGDENHSQPPQLDPDDLLVPWPVPQPEPDKDGFFAVGSPKPQLKPLSLPAQQDGGIGSDEELFNLDYGGFEEVWNWQYLNLDPYSGLPVPAPAPAPAPPI